jgi:hypothetical protein
MRMRSGRADWWPVTAATQTFFDLEAAYQLPAEPANVTPLPAAQATAQAARATT